MNNMNLFQQQQQRLYRQKKMYSKKKTVETIFSIYNDWWKNARAKIITFFRFVCGRNRFLLEVKIDLEVLNIN